MIDAVVRASPHPAPPRASAGVPAWLWAGGAFLVLAGVGLALPRWAEPPDHAFQIAACLLGPQRIPRQGKGGHARHIVIAAEIGFHRVAMGA